MPFLRLLAATALVGLLIAGAGTLVTFRLLGRGLLEKVVIRFALGTAVLPLAAIGLHEAGLVRISTPLLAGFGIAGLVVAAVEHRSRPGHLVAPDPGSGRGVLANRDTALGLLALAGFLAPLHGALLSPGFEGRDPWAHALGVRYVVETGSLRQPFPDWPLLQYVDAYPPLFDVLLSLPVGLTGMVNGPLKATNALVAGAVLPLLFLLALELFGDRLRATAATALWAVLPGNLTRQVWGHSVAVLLLLVGLFAVLRARGNKRWVLPAGVAFGGALLAAPSQGLVNAALLALAAAFALTLDRLWALRLVLAGSLALALALVWFGGVFHRYGLDPVRIAAAMQAPELRRSGLTEAVMAGTAGGQTAWARSPFAGSGPLRYNIEDFLVLRPYPFVLRLTGTKRIGDIAPEGLGMAASLLACAFLALAAGRRFRRKPPEARDLLALWLLAALGLLLGPWLGLAFFPWRMWLTVLPLSCLAAADALGLLAERIGPSRGSSPAAPSTVSLARVLALVLVVVAGLEFLAALHLDLAGPGPYRYLRWNLPFLGIPLAIGLLWLAERGAVPAGRGQLAVGLVLAFHVGMAAPVRLRTLTRPISPRGFFDAVEVEGYERTARLLPRGSAVLPLSGGRRFELLAGLDLTAYPWKREGLDLTAPRSRAISTSDLVRALGANGYGWVAMDPSLRALSPEAFERRTAELRATPGVTEVFRIGGNGSAGGRTETAFVLFRIGRT